MKVSPLRTKTISTKVSDQEQAQLESLAQVEGQSLAEWVRETLLARAATASVAPAEQILLGEVLALRAMMLNLLYAVSQGERISEERMRELIERADGDKYRKARERLSGTGARSAVE